MHSSSKAFDQAHKKLSHHTFKVLADDTDSKQALADQSDHDGQYIDSMLERYQE